MKWFLLGWLALNTALALWLSWPAVIRNAKQICKLFKRT